MIKNNKLLIKAIINNKLPTLRSAPRLERSSFFVIAIDKSFNR